MVRAILTLLLSWLCWWKSDWFVDCDWGWRICLQLSFWDGNLCYWRCHWKWGLMTGTVTGVCQVMWSPMSRPKQGVISISGQGMGPDLEIFSTLESSVFWGGAQMVKFKSRCHQCFENSLKSQDWDCKEGLTGNMWEVPIVNGVLQREEGTLKPLFTKMVGELDPTKTTVYHPQTDSWALQPNPKSLTRVRLGF